jgi:hypothetical protein
MKKYAKDAYMMIENPEKLVILTIYGEVAISTNYDSHYTVCYTTHSSHPSLNNLPISLPSDILPLELQTNVHTQTE